MADIEKVKNGIKNCTEEKNPCASCEYKRREECTVWLLKDALSVIEEQQAEIERLKAKQQPMIAKGINGTFGSGIGYCPLCGNGMHYANYPGQLTQHYCDQCGQAVKWSD